MRTASEVRDLRHGDHVCLLYRSSEEQKQAVTSFFKDGLARGERCIYIADEPRNTDLVQVLESTNAQRERPVHDAFQVLGRYQTFLRYARFEPGLMFEFFERTIETTLAKKFTGLRVASEMAWSLSTGCDQLIPFEALLNDHLSRWKITLLCGYPLPRFAPHIVRDVLRCHPVAWLPDQLCPNFYYEPPELVLSPDSSEARMEWMIGTLKKASALLTPR